MDYTEKPVKKNPRKGANLLSQLLFFWLVPVMFRVSYSSSSRSLFVCCSSRFAFLAIIWMKVENCLSREIMTAWANDDEHFHLFPLSFFPLPLFYCLLVAVPTPPLEWNRLHNFIKLIIPFSKEKKILILFSSSLSLIHCRAAFMD